MPKWIGKRNIAACMPYLPCSAIRLNGIMVLPHSRIKNSPLVSIKLALPWSCFFAPAALQRGSSEALRSAQIKSAGIQRVCLCVGPSARDPRAAFPWRRASTNSICAHPPTNANQTSLRNPQAKIARSGIDPCTSGFCYLRQVAIPAKGRYPLAGPRKNA